MTSPSSAAFSIGCSFAQLLTVISDADAADTASRDAISVPTSTASARYRGRGVLRRCACPMYPMAPSRFLRGSPTTTCESTATWRPVRRLTARVGSARDRCLLVQRQRREDHVQRDQRPALEFGGLTVAGHLPQRQCGQRERADVDGRERERQVVASAKETSTSSGNRNAAICATEFLTTEIARSERPL